MNWGGRSNSSSAQCIYSDAFTVLKENIPMLIRSALLQGIPTRLYKIYIMRFLAIVGIEVILCFKATSYSA